MTTAPSTMRPKSSVPRLMRFPETLNARINVAANSIDSGMIVATSRAPRQCPSSKTRTTVTRTAPSMRFLRTVPIVQREREGCDYFV
jgi:hypothetical protein